RASSGHINPVWVPLADRREHLVHFLRDPNLPGLCGQSQCMRRVWESLPYVEHTVRNGRVVENRDTAKLRNHFFEQLQPLPEQFSGKTCDAGHISAGMGKTLNKAGLDGIEPRSRHDDGNRLGCILSTLNE